MDYKFWIDFYDKRAAEYDKLAFKEEMDMFERKKNGEEIPLEMIYWVIMYNKYARDSRSDALRMKKEKAEERKIDFISEYNIRDSRQKSIIMSLKVEDFCHSTPNRNSGYEDEILYIFAPHVILYNADGEEETVAVYMKFNLISRPKGEYTVVISFHKLNYPIQYMFRQGG